MLTFLRSRIFKQFIVNANMFSGRLEELDNILIDNFLSCDTNSCFFLSHCHTDHMIGITQLFSGFSCTTDQFIYCSPISSLILLNKFGAKYKRFIKKLTTATVIKVPDTISSPGYEVLVTPIPAGHCPGSTMFLFEIGHKTILYTGDFRITKEDVKKIKFLHKNNEVKHINKLYFDSTFLNEVYWNFPLRTEVVQEIIIIINNWINKNKKNNVLFETPATYGYEYVFVEVAKSIKTKIHVKDSIYKLYWNIPEVGNFLTKDCTTAKVHAFPIFETKCTTDDKEWLKIKLSAQWFKTSKNNFKTMSWKKTSNNSVTICFATHCSCSELIDFLNYLHPDEVAPCSVPIGSSQNKVTKYIGELMWSWPKRKRGRSPESSDGNMVLNKNYKFKIELDNSERKIEGYFFEKD